MWIYIKKKEVTKHQNGKTINSNSQDEAIDLIIKMLYEPSDPYLKNKETNDMYRQFAEENKVTDIKSFLKELKWRWYATPGLGGKPEGRSISEILYNNTGPIPLLEDLKNWADKKILKKSKTASPFKREEEK